MAGSESLTTARFLYDGLDAPALARRVGAPAAVIYEKVLTVMDAAHRLAESGAPAGTVVLADEQTAGRGRAGRAWFSPPGAGIWLAIVLRPEPAPEGGVLAIRLGLATREALLAISAHLKPDLKWPNDLLAQDRKLGGVLCEARWTGARLGWVVAGIGLNVHGPLAAAVQDTAIAAAEVDPGLSRLAILEALVPRLMASGRHGEPLNDDERARYLAALSMPAGTDPVVGLDPDGALLVRAASGERVRRTEAA